MELVRIVTAAKLGDQRAFVPLVRHFQAALIRVARAQGLDLSDAEDVVQEAFVRAWFGLEALRNAEAFGPWAAAIVRNLARSRHRHPGPLEAEASDLDLVADPAPAEAPARFDPWEGLKPAQRQLASLRAAGFSLRQIGVVLGTSEARVKGRLYTVRTHLRRRRDEGPEAGPQGRPSLEETIMDKISALRLGAHVVERLSLTAQADLTLAVLAETPFPEAVLARIGEVDRGPEFLALYGPQIVLAELVGILNHVDRFTECRLVEHLEVVAPAQAETLKQNFFVFEDLILCDPSAVRLLDRTTDGDLWAQALAGTELRVKTHILTCLEPDRRADLEARISRADADRIFVRRAQERVVGDLHALEQAGRVIVQRPSETSGGQVYLTATV